MDILEKLDENLSQYYDNQMNISQLMHLETRMSATNEIKEYANDKMMSYYKISRSIKKVKRKTKINTDEMLSKIDFEQKNGRNLFKFNSVFFKRFNKFFRNFFLNINRHNS